MSGNQKQIDYLPIRLLNQSPPVVENRCHVGVSKRFSLRLCSHLVPEHQCPGTGTKWCCVQTLGTRYVVAQFSARVQGRDLVVGT